jgi:TRAP-type mannitol/chloroaromatic compound transport system permease small subunit
MVGRASAWLILLMVFLGSFNAVARKLGQFIGVNMSSNMLIELQWYMFSLVFLLGASYALRENAHVRVDVLIASVAPRTRALINLGGTVLLLMPFCIFTLWVSTPSVLRSFSVREGSPDPGGLPRYPLKLMIVVCFALLILQGVAEFIKEMEKLKHGEAGSSQPAPTDVPHLG